MKAKIEPMLWTLCAVWVTVNAISVETPQEVLQAARGNHVTLPCSYHTSASDRNGFIQWDKLLMSHSERVTIWKFSTKDHVYGSRYENRVTISSNAEQSDASITISQLTMEDNGTYECAVSLLEDLDGTSKSRVRLMVLVPPSPPHCSIKGDTVIGNSIELTCHSEEGSPAPTYSWKSYNSLNQERPLAQPVTGQSFLLKNISTDTSGYYICTSSNEMGSPSCNITVAVRSPSMNVALYAGIAGGVAAVLIIIGTTVYCCSHRSKVRYLESYKGPSEQNTENSRGQDEEDNDQL